MILKPLLKDPYMQINSHDMRYKNANAVHGFVKPPDIAKSAIQKQETVSSGDSYAQQKVTVINPQNISFALTGSLISPLVEESGAPTNSLVDKRHTMFS